MSRFLMMRLQGPMQSWGKHSFEDFRPSELFPTRSGLLGLLGACLGVERGDSSALVGLAHSVRFAVRVDARGNEDAKYAVLRLRDYHTVMEARRANRPAKPGETIQTWREYLFDAAFSVAVSGTDNARVGLPEIADALARPMYTPSLGRRSCPLAVPLFAGWQEAASAVAALNQFPPGGGVIFDENADGGSTSRPLEIRDVPVSGRHRAFATRTVWVRGKEA